MPRFDTPQPISVILEFDIGSARISAGKRTDTVVEVLPATAPPRPTCGPPSRRR